MQHKNYKTIEFPRSRIATFDIGAVGKEKHYVTALLELNVTGARIKIKAARRAGGAKISFTGWLLQTIGTTLSQHQEAAAFRYRRRKLMIFDDINISIVVEKDMAGTKVPLPLLIRKVGEKSIETISAEIESARKETISARQVVLRRGPGALEGLYYLLPGAVRRMAWRLMLRRPRFVFNKMGNAIVTAVGMLGQVNGWFIQTSVHPISFGIGSVTRKPVVVGREIGIGEILHMTVLLDHNAVDGAPMARFISALTKNIENGIGL